MVKVNVRENATPSQEIITAANDTVIVTDALGRKIKIKKLGLMERMDVIDAIGAESSKNEIYLGHALVCFSAVEIDGAAIPFASTKDEVRALFKNIKDEGLKAISAGLDARFHAKHTTEDEAKEAIKNA